MKTDDDTKQQHAGYSAELERLTDAYGGDTARWPAVARSRLEHLRALAPEADRLLADARALDRALDLAAPSSAAADPALADRIFAAAMRSAPPASDGVVWLPLYRTRVQAGLVARPPRMATSRMVAAVMAACLLVGIWLGGAVRVDPVLQDVADAVGLHADFEGMSTALADDAGEEDAL